MYKVIEKEILNPTVTKMVVEAPAVAKKALAGQFIILRVHEDGERIPLIMTEKKARLRSSFRLSARQRCC